MARNLIVGFATNQDRQSVEVFCKSALKSHSAEDCHIVIITNKYESYFLDLEKSGVIFFNTVSRYSKKTNKISKLINRIVLHSLRVGNKLKLSKYIPDIMDSYPLLIEAWHHPHFARWFAYKRYLEMSGAYGEIFIADVKDVVFQSSVFRNVEGQYLNLFKQHVDYGDKDWDTKWYREAWGERALSEIVGKPAICIGTLVGTLESVRTMVSNLVDFYGKYPFKGVEQAGFNYMIYNGKFDVDYSIVENIDNQVATLTAKAYPHVAFDGQNIVRKNGNSVIPAVHMYDRFAETLKVRSLYTEVD